MKKRKTRPMAERFWEKVDKRGPDECWPWTACVRRKDEGYGAFGINGRHRPAHRVAYELTHGPIPAGMVACHKCDNPPCCNPGHIFIGTNRDNDADRVKKGRQARGSRNGSAKLRERDVWAIRKLRAAGMAPKHLAQFFGITAIHVWGLCNEACWTHIDGAAIAAQVRADWQARARA